MDHSLVEKVADAVLEVWTQRGYEDDSNRFEGWGMGYLSYSTLHLATTISWMVAANEHPKWIDSPERMLTDLGVRDLAETIADDVWEQDIIQASVWADECMCGNCGSEHSETLRFCAEQGLERVLSTRAATIKESEERARENFPARSG